MWIALCVLSHLANAQTEGNSLLPLTIAVDKMVSASDRSFTNATKIIEALQSVPAELSQNIGNVSGDSVNRLNRAMSLDDSKYTRTVSIADEYLETHPEVEARVLACFYLNTTESVAKSCDMVSTLHEEVQKFLDIVGVLEKDAHSFEMHGSRPSAMNWRQTDLLKAGFWITAALYHIIHPVIQMEADILLRVIDGIRSSDHNEELQIIGDVVEALKNRKIVQGYDEQAERWRVIMSVFPTFIQFKRAFQHNPEFAKTILELCTNGNEKSENIQRQRATENALVESCWDRKHSDAFFKATFKTPTGTFLGIPKRVDFLLAILAFSLLFSTVDKVTDCPKLPSSENWQCTQLFAQGSICILQCENNRTHISKIDWSRPTVTTCWNSRWSPEESSLSNCKTVDESSFDYGITRSLLNDTKLATK